MLYEIKDDKNCRFLGFLDGSLFIQANVDMHLEPDDADTERMEAVTIGRSNPRSEMTITKAGSMMPRRLSELGLLSVAVTLAALLSACTQEAEDHRAIVDAMVNAFNANEPDRLDALVSVDVVRHGPPEALISIPGMPQGRDVIKAEWAGIKAAFPDAVMAADVINAQGAWINAHYKVTGTHQGPYYGVLPTGAPGEIRFAETYRLAGDEIAEIWTVTDSLNTLRFLTLPMPAPAAASHAPAEELSSFRPGRFVESIAFDEDGTAYVTSMFDGEILKLATDGSVEVFTKLPFGPMEGFSRGVICLVFDHEGGLNVDVSSSDPKIHGIWRFDKQGNGIRRAALPPHASPNGITIDSNGDLYIADAVHGTIWRVLNGSDQAQAWLVNPIIGPRPYLAMFPGANGIKIFDGAVYTVVSDTGRFVKVPILPDGSPGLPEVVAEGLPGDDFAFDSEGNVYMTTHPFNTVIRFKPDGSREILASVQQGVVGPTSVAFGTLPNDESTLYVLSDGGLSNPLPNQELRPNVVKLDIGISGNRIVN